MTGSFYILLACLFWSVDALIRYPLIQKIGAWSIVQSEHMLLSLIFLPILFKHRQKLWNSTLAHHFYFILLGVFGSALGAVCFTEAFRYLNPSVVILLQKYQPFVAIALARVILKERIQKRFLFWAAVSIIGAMGLSFPDFISEFKAGTLTQDLLATHSLKGIVFAVIAILSWGGATVVGKRLSNLGFKNSEIMGMRFVYGFIGLFIISFFFSDLLGVFQRNDNFISFLSTAPWAIWQKIIIMVLVSGVLAMGFYYAGLKKLSARSCSIMELFFPLCAIAVNWIYLGKGLDIAQIIGGALLILGATMVQTKHY